MIRSFIRAAVGAIALAVSAQASPAMAADPLWGAWQAPDPIATSTVVVKNVPIRMSDGVVLYADEVFPAGPDGTPLPGRFPVLVTQTPYNKNVGKPQAPHMVTHGYVQIVVDVRGTGSSEGTWDGLGSREQRDGFEIVEWAAEQPFSNGRIGLRGVSYLAVNEFFTAAQRPKGLKAMFPIVPMGDAYRDLFLQGGQVNTDFLGLWYGLVTGTSLVPPTYAPSDPGQAAKTVVNHAGGAVGYQGGQLVGAATGGDLIYDGPAYRLRSPLEVASKVKVPVFITGGWFDLFQRGEPMLFDALKKRKAATRLLMGPWYHNTPGEGLPSTGIPSLEEIELRWMNHYVKGDPDPTLRKDIPRVTYFDNGTDEWRAATSWPPKGIRYRQLHLGGNAAPGVAGTLGETTPAPTAADAMPWNPALGTCTRSTGQWTAGEGVGTPCDEDNRVNDLAALTYRMPVSKPLSIKGTMTARLFVSSKQGRDGLLSVRVEDVAPDGKTTQISAGWQTLSMRALDESKTRRVDGLIVRPFHPFTKASVQAMPADDTPVEVAVEIFGTSWTLAAGHTLQVSLQPSDAPHLTASAPQTAASAGGVLSIHHDAKYDSTLVIPVGPA